MFFRLFPYSKKNSILESLSIFRLIKQPIRSKLCVLFIFLFLNSIFELAVVSSFYPLLLSLTGNPASSTLARLNIAFFSDTQILLFAFCLLLILSYFIRIFTSYLVFKYSAKFTDYLLISLLGRLYSSPYISVNSCTGSYYSVIFTTRMQNMQTLFNQFFELLGFVLSSLFLLIALLAVDATLTLFLIFMLFTVYIILIAFVKRRVTRNSVRIAGFADLITSNILNVSDNLRSFFVANSSSAFLKRVSLYSSEWSLSLSQNRFISSFPRLAIEFLAFFSISIFLFAQTFFLSDENFGKLLSIVGVLILALQKLLPSVQGIYKSLIGIKNSNAYFSEIQKLHSSLIHSSSSSSNASIHKNRTDRFIAESQPVAKVEVLDLSYSYDISSKTLYSGLSHCFTKGSLNLLKGSSGAGKSTLIDILLGLRPPTSGSVLFNDINMYSDPFILKKIQSKMFFVPQSPTTIDGTLYENILFPGHYYEDFRGLIDEQYAFELFDFLNLPFNGTSLGDVLLGAKGLQLSGGEKQRLAIAKAFLFNPEIIILDEPTSALDYESTRLVHRLLLESCFDKLIIVSSHDPYLINSCPNTLELI